MNQELLKGVLYVVVDNPPDWGGHKVGTTVRFTGEEIYHVGSSIFLVRDLKTHTTYWHRKSHLAPVEDLKEEDVL